MNGTTNYILVIVIFYLKCFEFVYRRTRARPTKKKKKVPCPATCPYKYGFKQFNMSLKIDTTASGRCSVSLIFELTTFSRNIKSLCHLKMEIPLQIPASNDEKYN